MIDVSSEALLTLADAAKSLPNRPHVSSVVRWTRVGVRGRKLETILLGGRRFTSREALERFFLATTAAADGESPPPRSPKERERAIEQAERELGDAGI